MKKDNLDDYEPKAVLDFLSTCVFLKMQWQSNTHKPKHDSGPQDALKLSPDQVEVVLDVTINEARKLLVKPEQDIATADSYSRPSLQLIKSRVPLIVSCLNTTEKATRAMNCIPITINVEFRKPI